MTWATGALVLAAGTGSRAWPEDKLLAIGTDGLTMIGRVLRTLAASRIAQVVIVAGDCAERIVRQAPPGARLVVAPDHQEGIAASLRCGIAEAERLEWDRALVCLADMPLVRTATLDLLIAASGPNGRRPDAVVPMAGGRRGNPVRWDRRTFPALRGLTGDVGARTLLARAEYDVLAVETGDPGVLEDFDDAGRLALYRAHRD